MVAQGGAEGKVPVGFGMFCCARKLLAPVLTVPLRLLQAAHYLDIKPLLMLCCARTAAFIKGKAWPLDWTSVALTHALPLCPSDLSFDEIEDALDFRSPEEIAEAMKASGKADEADKKEEADDKKEDIADKKEDE